MTITSTAFRVELNDKGWRLTPQREQILAVFQALPQGEHLSVEDLQARLLANDIDISLSTIYRTVKLMARMAILRELELAEEHKHYELNQASSNAHHHLVCVQCSRTIEFTDNAVLKQSMKQVERIGYQLVDCQLIIYAVCPEAIRMGYPAVPSDNWMCSQAIADLSKHPKKIRPKHHSSSTEQA
jgi:Fur family transcriptional regulator, ferric uptake regulator